ncbi:aminotransferase class I/II-fold pyridoxal phosphate-dependent enzyme [Cellulosilyticum sp. I15G10I2]|uniref:aminotransferase class I/II-fold pyridoxal phosphate-dependent enzyme n=1 Tax=Cellulosilyticum sp. I15G10I2 TaxID=1892843 RepID=UPI00085BD371|nr:aminotransferase class I/II-fold pyridoxal phosphate-dependent enzyme [Cellulosilyticum sp. I15G10I2]
MISPLYNKLIDFSATKLSFHMPGHKFGTIADIHKINLSLLDNTEVVGMDNLYEADGIIKQAMELMADFYGAQNTIFLTNGATAGVLASIIALCKDNEKIIVARNCHHSVESALILSGAIPIYINPQYLQESHLLGEITPQDIRTALETYPDAKGVIIVSPTYEGIVSDVQAVADVVHEYEKILIVDEAHGAHFVIGEDFPLSSIHQEADIVINSMHKTLPALTQSALLHICSERVPYSDILSALRMIQTSSPSYMMMGLMDYIRCYILDNKDEIRRHYIDSLIEVRNNLKALKYLKLIELPNKQYDISKIVISTAYTNIDGYKLAEILNDAYNITVEAALSTYIILITTMADNKITLQRVEKALRAIDNSINHCNNKLIEDSFFMQDIAEGISLRKVYYADKEWMIIDQCEGKIITKAIMLYPPGVPMVCIGEVLMREHIKLVYAFKEKLQGIRLIDKNILVQVVKSTKSN